MSSLTTREIEAYVSSPAKKSGDLLTAYKIARDPTEWQRQRDEAQAEYETLQAAAMEYVDELHSGDEDDAGAKKSKKRKSESGKAAPADKKSKKAKLEQMAKSRVSPKTATDRSGSRQRRNRLPMSFHAVISLRVELPGVKDMVKRSLSASSRSPSLLMVSEGSSRGADPSLT